MIVVRISLVWSSLYFEKGVEMLSPLFSFLRIGILGLGLDIVHFEYEELPYYRWIHRYTMFSE